MKVHITIEEHPNNIMEFNVGKSGLTEEEFLRHVIMVAQAYLKQIEEDNANRT